MGCGEGSFWTSSVKGEQRPSIHFRFLLACFLLCFFSLSPAGMQLQWRELPSPLCDAVTGTGKSASGRVMWWL